MVPSLILYVVPGAWHGMAWQSQRPAVWFVCSCVPVQFNMRFVAKGVPQHVLPTVVLVDTSRIVRWQMTSTPSLGACVGAGGVQGVCHLTPTPSAGRNFWEVLRVLDSLQLTTLYDVGTPAHWKAPEDCFVLPHVPDEAAAKVCVRPAAVVAADNAWKLMWRDHRCSPRASQSCRAL